MIPLHEELKLRKQRKCAVAAALETGEKVADIAERFGMSQAYVSVIARQAGLGRYQKRRDRFPEIAADYRAGVPVKDICEKFSVDRKTVWNAAKKQGVQLRKGARNV
jgi:transcriptional regulator with XRE-family HTH domain